MNNLERMLQSLHCETADYMARELQKLEKMILMYFLLPF